MAGKFKIANEMEEVRNGCGRYKRLSPYLLFNYLPLPDYCIFLSIRELGGIRVIAPSDKLLTGCYYSGGYKWANKQHRITGKTTHALTHI